MKKLSRCLWSGVAAVSLLSLAGCGKSELEGKLIGSWKTNDTTLGTAQIMDYNDDGTLTLKMATVDMPLQWKVVDEGKIKFWPVQTGEDNATTVEITVNGDTMTERDVDGGDTMKYVRVPDGSDVTDADDKPLSSLSQADSDAAEGKVTPQVLSNANEDEKKFIEMYGQAIAHAEKATASLPDFNQAKSEIDAAVNLQMNHFGTPPRFNEANSKLRDGLLKYQSGLQELSQSGSKDQAVAAAGILDEANAAYATQILALHNGR